HLGPGEVQPRHALAARQALQARVRHPLAVLQIDAPQLERRRRQVLRRLDLLLLAFEPHRHLAAHPHHPPRRLPIHHPPTPHSTRQVGTPSFRAAMPLAVNFVFFRPTPSRAVRVAMLLPPASPTAVSSRLRLVRPLHSARWVSPASVTAVRSRASRLSPLHSL